jgi:hypothetical protein
MRPALEHLEDRWTPSIANAVSTFTDNSGNTATFDIHSDYSLWGWFQGQQPNQVTTCVTSVSVNTDQWGFDSALIVGKDYSLTRLDPGGLTPIIGYGVNHNVVGGPQGVASVVAEPNGRALLIDWRDNLWQFDPNLPVGRQFSEVDSHVTQATPMQDTQGTYCVADLHQDGSIAVFRINPSDNTQWWCVGSMGVGSFSYTSISSNTGPLAPTRGLYAVDSQGDLHEFILRPYAAVRSPVGLWQTADLGNAGGMGFRDVHVDQNDTNWVATTWTDGVYLNGQLIAGIDNAASAFAGAGGSFYFVTRGDLGGNLWEWSPQTHFAWGGGVTHFTYLDSHVSNF